MKILLVGATKLKFMPYMKPYIDILYNQNKIDIISWNRDLRDDLNYSQATNFSFDYSMLDEIPKMAKMMGYIRFALFTISHLRKHNYDLIIFTHILAGIIITPYIVTRYRKKYIIDFRDLSLEKNIMFRVLERILLKNSFMIFTSSLGYTKYFPKRTNQCFVPNLDCNMINANSEDVDKFASNKINITFYGFIRSYESNIKLISSLSNDSRFEVHYFGREQETAERLKKFVVNQKIINVFFHGEYMPNEKINILRNTSIINNLYDDDFVMSNAMSNKFYDGIFFGIPQIISADSYMGSLLRGTSLALLCSDFNDFADKLYLYYMSLDRIQFTSELKLERDKYLEAMSDFQSTVVSSLHEVVNNKTVKV